MTRRPPAAGPADGCESDVSFSPAYPPNLPESTLTIDLEPIRAARAALALLNPARNATLHELLIGFGAVDALEWLATQESRSDDLREFLGDVTVADLHASAAAAQDAADRAGAHLLAPEDDSWPARLDDLTRIQPPAAPSSALCLWARGPGGKVPMRAVAITGSRPATPASLSVAGDLGRGLADAGWTVAAACDGGIPAAALRGALAAGGNVVAVLPCGIDQPHPPGDPTLLHEVTDRGLAVSAYPPGTPPAGRNVTAVGRLLAGLTSATILIDTVPRSPAGAVTEAIRRGRRAMIVPGTDSSVLSVDARQAMRRYPAVHLAHNTADVLAELPTFR